MFFRDDSTSLGNVTKAHPGDISVKKTTSLMYALCKLHNYCIACSDTKIDQPSANDLVNITTEGGLYLPRMDKNNDAHCEYDMNVDVVYSQDRVLDQLDAGQHTDEHTDQERRKYRRARDLPCKVMLRYFALNAFKHPEINRMCMSKNK